MKSYNIKPFSPVANTSKLAKQIIIDYFAPSASNLFL